MGCAFAPCYPTSMDVLRGRPVVVLGIPLDEDLLDANGQVLLRRGACIQNRETLQRIVALGAALEGAPAFVAPRKDEVPPRLPRTEGRPGVFGQLGACSDLARGIFRDPGGLRDFERRVRAVGSAVIDAARRDSDAALAFVFSQDAPGDYPVRHQVDVSIIAAMLADEVGFDPVRTASLVCAALTMNLSMLDLQADLQKSPAALSKDARSKVRNHPIASAVRVRATGVTDGVWIEAVEKHHESLDGSGYPRGLSDQDIPQEAHVLHLIDMFCARIAIRARSCPDTPKGVLADSLLLAMRRSLPRDLCERFIRLIGFHPPGSVVRLANGEIAIARLRTSDVRCPRVVSLALADGTPLESPVDHDTADPRFAIVSSARLGDLPPGIDLASLWAQPPAAVPWAGGRRPGPAEGRNVAALAREDSRFP